MTHTDTPLQELTFTKMLIDKDDLGVLRWDRLPRLAIDEKELGRILIDRELLIARGSSVKPCSWVARHSGISVEALSFTRSISALPSVAATIAMKSPKCERSDGTSRKRKCKICRNALSPTIPARRA